MGLDCECPGGKAGANTILETLRGVTVTRGTLKENASFHVQVERQTFYNHTSARSNVVLTNPLRDPTALPG